MSKVAYITLDKTDDIMSSLGFSVISTQDFTTFDHLVRHLMVQQYAIAFVSEAVYLRHESAINAYNDHFSISLIVLANALHHQHLGQKRLKGLIEDAVGLVVK